MNYFYLYICSYLTNTLAILSDAHSVNCHIVECDLLICHIVECEL